MITAPTVAKVLRFGRKVGFALIFLSVATLVFAAFCDWFVSRNQENKIYEEAAAVPYTPVALVLGTTHRVAGRPNAFYENRLNAVAELYRQRRISHILVSGDNATLQYNEPTTMQQDLIEMGIPSESITLDYAGFRTLDSVVRAKEIFQLPKFVVVSQRFHCVRALFLAEQNGIDAIAFTASDVTGYGGLRTRAREVLARTKAVLDVYILNTRPKFLGEVEEIDTFELP